MKPKDIPLYVLGALIVGAYFVLLYLLVFQPVPAENQRLLDIASGALLTSFAAVVGYFYGSSKGSSDKNDIISQSNKPQ